MRRVDYSQYKEWSFCPHSWFEKYVNKKVMRSVGMNDGAMTLGSLVHAGLENWHGEGTPEIPQKVVEEQNPTPEALGIAQQMVLGYVRRYPTEPWTPTALEKPLVRNCRGFDVLAKVDGYFVVDEAMQVEDGNGGILFLNPGVYGLETKTRDATQDRARYMQRWQVNMQADFQLLALREVVDDMNIDSSYEGAHWVPEPRQLQGIIINVIDKPRPYVPKRTCKGCKQVSYFNQWIVSPDGRYACPVCKYEQVLQPLKPVPPKEFDYWRMMVTRTPEQLERALGEIQQVAFEMDRMEKFQHLPPQGEGCVVPPTKEMCVHPITGKVCQYFRPHLLGYTTVGHPDFEDARDYVGVI